MISLSHYGTLKLLDRLSHDHDAEVMQWKLSLQDKLKEVNIASNSHFAHSHNIYIVKVPLDDQQSVLIRCVDSDNETDDEFLEPPQFEPLEPSDFSDEESASSDLDDSELSEQSEETATEKGYTSESSDFNSEAKATTSTGMDGFIIYNYMLSQVAMCLLITVQLICGRAMTTTRDGLGLKSLVTTSTKTFGHLFKDWTIAHKVFTTSITLLF